MVYSLEISVPQTQNNDKNKHNQVYNIPFEDKMKNIEALLKESDDTIPNMNKVPTTQKKLLKLGILKEVPVIEKNTSLVSELEKIQLITENELFVNPSELCVIDDVSKRIHFVLSDTSFYYKLFGFSDDTKETLKLLNELKIYDYIRNLSDDKKKYFVPVIGVYKIENSSIIEKNVNISSQKKSKTLYVTKTGKISESITTIIDRKTKNSSFLTYTILQNIFLAVKEMHEIGIVHLDLHLGNFLVDEDNKVYIFDFDTSYLKGVSDGPFTESSEPNVEVIKKIDILKLLKNLIIYDINGILKFNPSDQTIYANIVSQLEDDSYINSIRDAKEQMSSIFGDKSASDIIDVLLNSIVQTCEKKYKKS
jgi:serine/threonine protein kinase